MGTNDADKIHLKHCVCSVNKKNSRIVCRLFFLLYALQWIKFFFLLHAITWTIILLLRIGELLVRRFLLLVPFLGLEPKSFFFRRPVTASHYFLLGEKRKKTLKRIHEKFLRNTYSFTT